MDVAASATLGKGIGRLAPDGGGHLPHALDEPAAPSRHLGTETPGRPAGDVLGQVAVALHVGQHAQDRDVLAPFVRRRLAVHELVLHRRRDLPDQLVDDLVSLDQLLGRVAVAGEEGVGGAGDAFADEREDLCEEAVDLVRLGHRARPQGLLDGQGPPGAGSSSASTWSGAVFVLSPSLKGIRVTLPVRPCLTTANLRRPRHGSSQLVQAIHTAVTPHRYLGPMVIGVLIGLVIGVGRAGNRPRLAPRAQRRASPRRRVSPRAGWPTRSRHRTPGGPAQGGGRRGGGGRDARAVAVANSIVRRNEAEAARRAEEDRAPAGAFAELSARRWPRTTSSS